MFDLFLLKAFLASGTIALIAGPLGSMILWRRMAFFGDTLAHSSLLGIAISLFFNISYTIGFVSVAITVALILSVTSQQRALARDTWLALVSHGALATALVAMSLGGQGTYGLTAYLFGDLLAVDWQDLMILCMTAVCVLGVLVIKWRSFLALIIEENIAIVEGIPVKRLQALFMVLIGIIIAISIKIIGALLITALLIIPAASARQFAKTPEQMAYRASMIGLLSAVLGLVNSYYFDTPASATIVVTAMIFFLMVQLVFLTRRA